MFWLLTIIFLTLFSAHSRAVEIKSLSLDQKIGQLFIVPACPLREGDHLEDLRLLVKNQHIGGILFKQGTVPLQRALIAHVQKMGGIPLLCAQDGEWGVGMRLFDVVNFPKNLTLGAVRNEELLSRLGMEIGRQCKYVGSHLNLAPVVDINSNPYNPIIHMRSFGEDSEEVALRGALIMQGMQSMGVFACAKHFPGHGDTEVDSHLGLPAILHDATRLRAIELHPFEILIQKQVRAVMSAHLDVPALTQLEAMPVTFSQETITEILQKELGFQGLVITDALNMKALSGIYTPEEIAVRAFLAGHDLLLYGDHIAPNIDHILRDEVPRAFSAIKQGILSGEIPEELLDHKVEKILRAKAQLGLFEESKEGDLEIEELNSLEAFALKKALFQEALTLLRNEEVVPLPRKKIVLIEWGETPWLKAMLKEQGITDCYALEDLKWKEEIDGESVVVLAMANIRTSIPEFGIHAETVEWLAELKEANVPVVAALFGTPYSLLKTPLFEGLIMAYENEREAQEAVGELLLGKIQAKGRLPVSIFPHFPRGMGL